ncbi:hypothetical protein FT643_08920 [Ketobacter sp. MCCC 1A13808]|uniref:hypothetical protein n=1 Tax=Ketobacter sp. MCCC 1A13808 TaxID=2602738 RepID=UPI0012EBC2B3|nr:hypothetical protein [Ketobacter sp. MCCC 1A13808]MVF12267.1 hypothetical protein [Ketobacter sp. MCCC 1A13808]
MSQHIDMTYDSTIQLDQRSREAVERINRLIDQSGGMAFLLAVAHIFGWLDRDVGLATVATNDWDGFYRTLCRMEIIELEAVRRVAASQLLRFTFSDSNGQKGFWEGVVSSAEKAKRKSIR